MKKVLSVLFWSSIIVGSIALGGVFSSSVLGLIIPVVGSGAAVFGLVFLSDGEKNESISIIEENDNKSVSFNASVKDDEKLDVEMLASVQGTYLKNKNNSSKIMYNSNKTNEKKENISKRNR